MSIPMHENAYERIEWALGRKILNSEAGSINSFREFSESDLNDFKLIMKNDSFIMTIALIRFKLKENIGVPLAMSYIQAVVEYGESVDEWMKENNL